MNGNLQWMRWHRDEPYTSMVNPDKWHQRDRGMHFTASFVPSPILFEDKLLVNANISLRAYDKGTGETLWEHKLRQVNYMLGPPVPLMLQSPGGNDVPCVFISSGELVRVADGKILLEDIGNFAAAVAPIALGSNRIFGVNGMSGGHYHIQENRQFTDKGGIAVRFRLVEENRAEAELLWFNRHADDYEMMPVYQDGVLYMNRLPFAFEASTGERLGIGDRGKASEHRTSESLSIAGGHLFTLNDGGRSAVFTADPSLELVARNQLDETAPIAGDKRQQIIAQTGIDEPATWYAWQFGRSSPFFSGNRIFIRSFDALYSIGNPAEPFRPSRAFAAATDGEQGKP